MRYPLLTLAGVVLGYAIAHVLTQLVLRPGLFVVEDEGSDRPAAMAALLYESSDGERRTYALGSRVMPRVIRPRLN